MRLKESSMYFVRSKNLPKEVRTGLGNVLPENNQLELILCNKIIIFRVIIFSVLEHAHHALIVQHINANSLSFCCLTLNVMAKVFVPDLIR